MVKRRKRRGRRLGWRVVLNQYFAGPAARVVTVFLAAATLFQIANAELGWFPAPTGKILWALVGFGLFVLPILVFGRVWRRLEVLSWSFESGRPVAPSWLEIDQKAVSYGDSKGYHLRAEIRRHKDSPEPESLEFGCTWEVGAQATIEKDPIGSIASEKKYIVPWPTGTHSFRVGFEETGFPSDWCLVLYVRSNGPVLIRRVWADT